MIAAQEFVEIQEVFPQNTKLLIHNTIFKLLIIFQKYSYFLNLHYIDIL